MTGKIGLSYRAFKQHDLGLEFKREMHNYTADLIRNLISMNHLTFSYNLYLPSRIGLFSQFIYTDQSDGNIRKLFYGSAYYNIKTFPMIKIGSSISMFGFEKDDVMEYFSPSSYRAMEIFIHFANEQDKRAKLLYNVLIALGNQKIEEEENQNIRRIELGLGFRLAQNFQLNAYFNTSNAAQTSVTGFSSSIIGLRGVYTLPARVSLIETQ